MKVSAAVLSNLAWARLQHLLDDDLGNSECRNTDISSIEEAELLVGIKRALVEKKKRIVLDVRYSA